MTRVRSTLFLLGAAILIPVPGFAQHYDSASAEKLGSVTFSTSCSSEAEPQFNRAVALMHSFQFARAIEGFHAALASDRMCSIAYWGIALSSWGNPFAAGLKSQAQLQPGLEAVKLARATPPKTERERAYVEAVAHLFPDTGTADQHSRILAYEDAMDALRATYPDDVEASIFYALALAASADPADKSYANQLKAGAILESLIPDWPTTSFMHTTFLRWLHGLSKPHTVIARSLLRRRTHCTCHPIRLRESATGRILSTPTSPPRLQRDATTNRPKSCTPATTWSMRICRQPRTTPPNAWWNRLFRHSPALIQQC